jgi:hypothetical protein
MSWFSRKRHGSRQSKDGGDQVQVPILLGNRFAGLPWVFEECDCGYDPSPVLRFHTDTQDTDSEAWQQLLALIDEAAEDGREVFAPGAEMPEELWGQIVTLPASIARLSAVKQLNIYGSNLIMVPPEIGEMTNLEDFRPYVSRRLHWFPYEITRCPKLVDSTVSTRNIYGNFKLRTPFPQLPAELPKGSTPDCCSVCDGPLPASGAIQAWISLLVATDVLPLLVHSCSEECIRGLPRPEGYKYQYVNHPHQGGPELVQPKGEVF